MSDIVERLKDEAQAMHSTAWSRRDGGQECTLSAILAEEAAETITSLRRELAEAREIIARMQSDRLYVIGWNDGWEKALDDAACECEARHANGNRKYSHADECAASIRSLKQPEEGDGG